MHEWTVSLGLGATSERVESDGWQIGPNGDLVFINIDERGREPFFIRAFAAGRWVEVSLYA